MTEIYHGPWNSVRGDVPKEREQDAYHRYPVSKPAGVLNEPLSGAYQTRVVNTVASAEGNGK